MHELIEQGWVKPRTSLVRAEKGDVICLQIPTAFSIIYVSC